MLPKEDNMKLAVVGTGMIVDLLASTTPEEVATIYVAVPNFLPYSFCKQALEAGLIFRDHHAPLPAHL